MTRRGTIFAGGKTGGRALGFRREAAKTFPLLAKGKQMRLRRICKGSPAPRKFKITLYKFAFFLSFTAIIIPTTVRPAPPKRGGKRISKKYEVPTPVTVEAA